MWLGGDGVTWHFLGWSGCWRTSFSLGCKGMNKLDPFCRCIGRAAGGQGQVVITQKMFRWTETSQLQLFFKNGTFWEKEEPENYSFY